MNIGKHLKELREKKCHSIRALSTMMDISHNTLAAYERDNIIPTLPMAEKICNFFGVPMEYLLYGKNSLAEFRNMKLLELAKQVDELGKEEVNLAKKYLKKLIKNVEERKELIEEAEK
ncbi:MAG: helix-turn-helix transcriptional regulator [Spirochaetales bacterium]|nr:helix-turn-helix transcriptional regulator [Spirochaetales bacterium]